MASYPADLRYTREHEWARAEGTRARVGITEYAQDQLGDVVFVELPKVGTRVRQMQSLPPYGGRPLMRTQAARQPSLRWSPKEASAAATAAEGSRP